MELNESMLSFDISNYPVSIIIFISTIIISIYTLFKNRLLIEKLMFRPYDIIEHKQYYRFISSGFVHADTMHLGFNMMSYFFFAFELEAVTGSLNFFLIYFLGIIIAVIPSFIKYKNSYSYASLGASGGISAILFSAIVYSPFSTIRLFPIPFGIPAFLFGILYLAWCWWAARKSDDLINHDAHFWGAIAGIILTLLLDRSAITFFIQSFN